MRWPWRREPDLPPDESNGSVAELKEYARAARRRAIQDRQRVARAVPRIADLPQEEFVARVAELFRARYP